MVASDLHVYDVQSETWTAPEVSPRPAGRFAHAACPGEGASILVFGGINPEENLTGVVVLGAP